MGATSELILFTVSILPVIVIGAYIYKKDKCKEPARLLAKLFLGGIGSCFLVLIVSFIMGFISPIFSADAETLNLFELLIHVFIGVALVEEACKWSMLYLISFNDESFDELYDAILFGMFVALGFACFENLLYVYQNGVGVGILRAILAVPGHACDGMFMGYYLGLSKAAGLNKRKDLKNKNLLLSIVVPTITHGIYDYCLFTGSTFFTLVFIGFVIYMYVYTVKRIKKISNIHRKMKYRDNYCPNCGREVDGNYCPICGRKNE